MRSLNYFLIFSLLGHGIFLLLFMIKLTEVSQAVNLGGLQPSFSSYVYYESSKFLPEKNQTQAQAITKTQSLQKIVTKKSTSLSTQQTSISKAAGNGKHIPELVALLHAAIQKQQHYPVAALQMEREGKITLKFILFPNGSIQDLKIIQASGTDSLDEAALAAVLHAAPFQGVEKYLTQAATYQVTVGFELT